MSCFNFIIMKVNGADVSNLPYEEAVQLFLNAEDPILVEVRRRCFDESNILNFFNYDTHQSPTLAVIAASTNTPNLYGDGVEVCRISAPGETPKTVKQSSDENPAISSISCQTDFSAFDSDSKEIIFMKGDTEFSSGTFFCRKSETLSTDAIVDGCLKTEFDIEEITLRKSQSAENLGFTISYSTEDFSGSESGSEECVNDSKDIDGEYNLNDLTAQRCKIYVSDIVPNSLADRDGRLRQGDRILQINGQNVLEKVDPNKLLTENKYSVTILVSRYAYAGEDDFLDSAVYCDDKECQDDRHLSSVCECEQNTFSSKSSISQSEQKICTPTTVTNIYPILPIAVEKVSDLLNHASIKAQLESVNKEITLLNSQITIMKLQQQLQTENQASAVEKQSSPLKAVKDQLEKPIKMLTKKCVAETPQSKSKTTDLDVVEHIYETIAGDTESDAYYCSPYEGVNEMRVEQWLKSIGCTKSHVQSVNEKSKNEMTSVAARLQKNNPILDDYDNSSSAYNTGGSCNSALLAHDQQSQSTLLYHADRHNTKKLASKCKNVLHASSKHLLTTCRNPPNILVKEKPQQQSVSNRRTPIPSTSVPIRNHCPTDIDDSDGHSTLVAKSSIYRMCQYKAVEEQCKEDLSEMVWKVKRRPDGTRYIVKRVIKKCPPTTAEKLSPDDQQMDSASAVSFKRQAHKLKERRQRQRNPATPSKEKHHAQHWLV